MDIKFNSPEEVLGFLREHFSFESYYDLCMVAEDVAQYGLAKGLAINGLGE